MRMNCLPYLYEAGQVLMMRLIFKLSSKLSLSISFRSTTSKRLKPQLQHESTFLFIIPGPMNYLFENWPNKTWAPTYISLPSHTTSDVNTTPLTLLLCPPSHSQFEDTVWPSSHANPDPCGCCTDPALPLPPAPGSRPQPHPAAGQAETSSLFNLIFSIFFFFF